MYVECGQFGNKWSFTNALYSDLAWSAVSEEVQPDSCKYSKSLLNLFTSNSVLCVEIIDDESNLR